ncbi:MAG: hypothetical protein ACE37K_14225 [Planctomycetota bacterium]|jgi:Na+/proline symporter
MTRKLSSGGKFAWGLVVLLAILHYDFWFWGDRSVAFGFLPVGLLFQALISLGAAIAWALVVRFAWPTHIEEWADRPVDDE